MQQKMFNKCKEYYRLNTIVSKNVSINTLTNVTKEVQYCFVSNCRGGVAVTKCFEGKLLGILLKICKMTPYYN